MNNPYKTLQVDPEASFEVIKAAYRTLMKTKGLHPDLGGDVEKAQALNEAYEQLSDPDKRLRINRELRAHNLHPEHSRPETVYFAMCLHCGTTNNLPFRSFIYTASCGKCGQPFVGYKEESPQRSYTAQKTNKSGTGHPFSPYRSTAQKSKPMPKKEGLSPVKLAVFLYEHNLFPRAIEQLNEILKSQSENLEALHLLGMSYYRLQRYRDATKPFLTTLKLKPDHYLASLYLGKALMRLTEYKEAVPYLQKADQLSKGNPKLMLLLANSYFMSDQFVEAAEVFARLVELEPSNANTLFLMGMSYFKANKLTKAYDTFRRGRSNFPENPKFERMVKATVDSLT